MLILSRNYLFCISFVFTYLINTIILAQTGFRIYKCSDDYSRNNQSYHKQLKSFLSVLLQNSIDGAYHLTQYGGGDDTVFITALCRGDLDDNSCHNCVKDLTLVLPDLCPNQKSAIMSNNKCMLKYSNTTGLQVTIPSLFLSDSNSESSMDMDRFTMVVNGLINRLIDKANVNYNPYKYFADGEESGPNHTKIFGFVQCDPVAIKHNCGACLRNAYNESEFVCQGKTGCFGLWGDCNFRYGPYQFFNMTKGSITPPPPPPPSDKNNTKNADTTTGPSADVNIIIVLISILILVISISIFINLRLRRRYKNELASVKKEDELDEIGAAEFLKLDFSIVKASTSDFSQQNELGRGGFGTVYKGMLPDGREIAVKRLSPDSRQGEREFKNEVLLMSQFLHRNLVKLIGFSIQGNERLLIYEFLANSSLDSFIFCPAKRGRLDWRLRCNIIDGIAKGLLYLHEESGLSVVHRDLKASNVLLDEKMNSKIADFGMARLYANREVRRQTDRICGTYGYMAPEYAMQGNFSLKSDVFSFGVLVLEIITGQSNQSACIENTNDDFLTHIWKNWQARTCSNIIDREMNAETGQIDQILKVIHIGLLCCHVNANERPTMDSVVRYIIRTVSMSMPPEPSEPSYYLYRNIDPANTSITQIVSR